MEAAELVGHIFTALRQRGLSGVIHIQAYADTSILPVEVNSGLSSTGVHLLHVARGRKEASDKAILVRTMASLAEKGFLLNKSIKDTLHRKLNP